VHRKQSEVRCDSGARVTMAVLSSRVAGHSCINNVDNKV
jgi:hypothetical protein